MQIVGGRRAGRYSRRMVLQAAAGSALLGAVTSAAGAAGEAADQRDAWFVGRGVAIVPTEAAAMELPERAGEWDLNLIDMSHYAEWAAGTDEGRALVAACRRLGVGIEFSLHVPSMFLSRTLFEKDPTLFRMDESGNRTPDANLCVHSEPALEILCENAVKYADLLRPTTGRYHYWTDDGAKMCRCPRCRGLSDSDQALIVENRMLKALRRGDRRARVAHLAYQPTLVPPTQVKPEPGIYLEFAPIERDSLKPLDNGSPVHTKVLEHLDANLALFGKRDAEVLEYWLDNSRASGWKRERIGLLPWSRETYLRDLRVYAGRGIRRMRTYAYWFDADYVGRYGPPPLAEYGAGLRRWHAVRGRPVERA
ncbi:MAG: DUF4838 domain-containing protein [Chthonomonadales bacterium]|nr:DUF4838 domain-containing protein [Chthonomonadales bacterium]